MGTIKPLAKRRPLRRWLRRLFGIKPRASDLLANIDEMHETRPSWTFSKCPCCGADILRPRTATQEPRPDGRTIARTIIDDVPPFTDRQKEMEKFLKEVAPGYPAYAYKTVVLSTSALRESPFDKAIEEARERLDGGTTNRNECEINIKAVDYEEHLKMHQRRGGNGNAQT